MTVCFARVCYQPAIINGVEIPQILVLLNLMHKADTNIPSYCQRTAVGVSNINDIVKHFFRSLKERKIKTIFAGLIY